MLHDSSYEQILTNVWKTKRDFGVIEFWSWTELTINMHAT